MVELNALRLVGTFQMLVKSLVAFLKVCVLGPLLFLLFINDIGCMFGDDVTGKLFADDLKMYVTVNYIKGCQVLQHGLNILYDWTIKWQLNIYQSM